MKWSGLSTKTTWLHLGKNCSLGSNNYITLRTVHTLMSPVTDDDACYITWFHMGHKPWYPGQMSWVCLSHLQMTTEDEDCLYTTLPDADGFTLKPGASNIDAKGFSVHLYEI